MQNTQLKKKKSPAPKFQVKILNKKTIKNRVTQQVRDESARILACIIDFSIYSADKFLPQFFHLSNIWKILKEPIIITN